MFILNQLIVSHLISVTETFNNDASIVKFLNRYFPTVFFIKNKKLAGIQNNI